MSRTDRETKRIDGKLYQVLRDEILREGDLIATYFCDDVTLYPTQCAGRHADWGVGNEYYRPIEEKKTAPKPETVTIEISRETAEHFAGSVWFTDPYKELQGVSKKALLPKLPSKEELEELVWHQGNQIAAWALYVLEHGYEPEGTDE